MKTINTLIPKKSDPKALKWGFEKVNESPKVIVLVSIKTHDGIVVARNAPIAGFITEEDAKSFISQKKYHVDLEKWESTRFNRQCFVMSYRYRIIPSEKYKPTMTMYE